MPLDATPPLLPPFNGAMQRIGTLVARGWQTKLYAPAAGAAGLRPEDLAAADRAYRAGIAAPGASRVAGFALLQPASDAGSLTFSAYWWDEAMLHRVGLVLPGCGSPPTRQHEAIGRIGSVDELCLMAREACAWRRSVLDAASPSLDAYLAECCA